MENEDSRYLVDGKYGIADLVDLAVLERVFAKFSSATGFTTGFLAYPSQEVLIKTGWRDACTRFHRATPGSAIHCRESNVELSRHLRDHREVHLRRCGMGLVDGATPIVVRDAYVAYLATGQVFFEAPDLERYRAFADEYGYDPETYLAAIREVPVVTEERFRAVLSFLSEIAQMIAGLGLSGIELKERSAALEADIVQRIGTEEALRQSEERYRSLIQATGTGYVILDAGGRVLDANGEYLRLTGRAAREEILGHSVIEWTAPYDLERNAAEVRRCVEERRVRNLEIDYRRPDGSVQPIEINASVVSHGAEMRILTLCRDISARRSADQERIALEASLHHAQKLESLGVLAGGIAHDFNNLLLAILGNLDLALMDLEQASPARRSVDEAIRSTRRAEDLTRQMLAYSGRSRFVLGPVSLSDLVVENAGLLRACMAKTTSLELSIDREAPMVDADVGQMQQVVMNLITNAADALGGSPGTIRLTTGAADCDAAYLAASRLDEKAPPGRYVYLEVVDGGCGMDEHTQARLFDPFFTTKATGRGLGMSVVSGVVRGHRGAILFDSAVGKGTTIRVLFPASSESPARPRVSAETGSPPAPTKQDDAPHGMVLIADDEETVRVVCARMLERMGLEVCVATDGIEALELHAVHGPRITCAILDLSMPRMDGLAALRELRRRSPSLAILLSSGFSEQDASRHLGLEEPDGFIQKPYRLDNLRAALSTAFATARRRNS